MTSSEHQQCLIKVTSSKGVPFVRTHVKKLFNNSPNIKIPSGNVQDAMFRNDSTILIRDYVDIQQDAETVIRKNYSAELCYSLSNNQIELVEFNWLKSDVH